MAWVWQIFNWLSRSIFNDNLGSETLTSDLVKVASLLPVIPFVLWFYTKIGHRVGLGSGFQVQRSGLITFAFFSYLIDFNGLTKIGK